MITCILIDRTKIEKENTSNKFYEKDIREVEMSQNDLPKIESPFNKPVPFFYNLFKASDALIKIVGADLLHWSYVNHYELLDKQLIMVTACPGLFSYNNAVKMSNLFKSGNPKAIFINKDHQVWSNALFFVVGGNLTRNKFMKYVYDMAPIESGNPTYETNIVPKTKIDRKKIALDFLGALTSNKY